MVDWHIDGLPIGAAIDTYIIYIYIYIYVFILFVVFVCMCFRLSDQIPKSRYSGTFIDKPSIYQRIMLGYFGFVGFPIIGRALHHAHWGQPTTGIQCKWGLTPI